MAKMSSSANQPVCVGHTRSTRSRRQKKKPRPAEPSRYLSTPAPRKSTPSSFTSTGSEPIDWNASSSTSAPRSCASSTILGTSVIAPLRYETCVTDTSSVSSSISRSSSSSVPPCTTRAPRASCACQICPIVGNSQSVSTTFERRVKRSPLASALTPADSEVVTAISSGPALTRLPKEARAASCRSTQYSHGAPYSSQSARYCSYDARTASDSAPCE